MSIASDANADQPKSARMSARPDTRGPCDQNSPFAGGGGREIVDAMIDDYVTWREACAAVAGSYENWRRSDPPDEKLAFSVYVAALDREDQAAAAYQRAVGQVATALAGRDSSSLEGSSRDGRHLSAEVTGVQLAGGDRDEGAWFDPRTSLGELSS
jgi:hypothetical protein